MQHRSDEDIVIHAVWAMDGLGCLIQWSLEDAVAGADPPSDMWCQISGRIAELDQRPRRHLLPDIASFPWNSLLQTVVVTTLLLTFVLGVDRRTAELQSPAAAMPAPRTQPVTNGVEFPDDLLSGRLRFLLEHENAVPKASSASVSEPSAEPGASAQTGPFRRGAAWKDVELPE